MQHHLHNINTTMHGKRKRLVDETSINPRNKLHIHTTIRTPWGTTHPNSADQQVRRIWRQNAQALSAHRQLIHW
jgi:hypothetical protein